MTTALEPTAAIDPAADDRSSPRAALLRRGSSSRSSSACSPSSAIGVGALYAWDQQYDGRVLPGVRVGGTSSAGSRREQAAARIADAYGVARQRADHAHRPGRPR